MVRSTSRRKSSDEISDFDSMLIKLRERVKARMEIFKKLKVSDELIRKRDEVVHEFETLLATLDGFLKRNSVTK